MAPRTRSRNSQLLIERMTRRGPGKSFTTEAQRDTEGGRNRRKRGRIKTQDLCIFLRPTWVSPWIYLCALCVLCGEVVRRFSGGGPGPCRGVGAGIPRRRCNYEIREWRERGRGNHSPQRHRGTQRGAKTGERGAGEKRRISAFFSGQPGFPTVSISVLSVFSVVKWFGGLSGGGSGLCLDAGAGIPRRRSPASPGGGGVGRAAGRWPRSARISLTRTSGGSWGWWPWAWLVVDGLWWSGHQRWTNNDQPIKEPVPEAAMDENHGAGRTFTTEGTEKHRVQAIRSCRVSGCCGYHKEVGYCRRCWKRRLWRKG